MNSLFEVGHKFGDTFRSTVAQFTPVPTESKFVEEGTLTPAEFLQAGDQLCYKFPSWQWEKGQDKNQAQYLPPDKQYLITRNVRCKERVRDLDDALPGCCFGSGFFENSANCGSLNIAKISRSTHVKQHFSMENYENRIWGFKDQSNTQLQKVQMTEGWTLPPADENAQKAAAASSSSNPEAKGEAAANWL